MERTSGKFDPTIYQGQAPKSGVSAVMDYVGELLIEKVLPDGSRVPLLHKKNLVVTTGKNFGASRLISNTEFAALAAIGVGTGSTAPAITDTALGGSLLQKAFDAAATRSGNTVSMTTTFNAGEATGSWSEAGLFNAASAGTMFSRTTFTAIPKGASDVIAVTWNVTAN